MLSVTVFSDKRGRSEVICRKMSKPVCCGFRQNDLFYGVLSEKKFPKLKFCGFRSYYLLLKSDFFRQYCYQ